MEAAEFRALVASIGVGVKAGPALLGVGGGVFRSWSNGRTRIIEPVAEKMRRLDSKTMWAMSYTARAIRDADTPVIVTYSQVGDMPECEAREFGRSWWNSVVSRARSLVDNTIPVVDPEETDLDDIDGTLITPEILDGHGLDTFIEYLRSR